MSSGKYIRHRHITLVGRAIPSRKARMAERDKLIVTRYWWYVECLKMSSSYIIEVLSYREFYLADRYTSDIIMRGDDVLMDLRANPPSVHELRERYPSFIWVATPSI